MPTFLKATPRSSGIIQGQMSKQLCMELQLGRWRPFLMPTFLSSLQGHRGSSKVKWKKHRSVSGYEIWVGSILQMVKHWCMGIKV